MLQMGHNESGDHIYNGGESPSSSNAVPTPDLKKDNIYLTGGNSLAEALKHKN